MAKTITLTLTRAEYGAVSEAIRLSQQINKETIGRLIPELSRVQRKLGEEAGDE